MSDFDIRPSSSKAEELLRRARSAELAAVRARREQALADCPPLYRLEFFALDPDQATPNELTHVARCRLCTSLIERARADAAPSALQRLIAQAQDCLAAILGSVPLPALGFSAAGPIAEDLRRTSPDGRLEVEVLPNSSADHLTVLAASRDPKLEQALIAVILLPSEEGESVADFTVLVPEVESGWFVAELLLPVERLQPLGGSCRGVEAAPVEVGRLEAAGRQALLGAIAKAHSTPQAAIWRAWVEHVLASEPGLPADFRDDLARITGAADIPG